MFNLVCFFPLISGWMIPYSSPLFHCFSAFVFCFPVSLLCAFLVSFAFAYLCFALFKPLSFLLLLLVLLLCILLPLLVALLAFLPFLGLFVIPSAGCFFADSCFSFLRFDFLSCLLKLRCLLLKLLAFLVFWIWALAEFLRFGSYPTPNLRPAFLNTNGSKHRHNHSSNNTVLWCPPCHSPNLHIPHCRICYEVNLHTGRTLSAAERTDPSAPHHSNITSKTKRRSNKHHAASRN